MKYEELCWQSHNGQCQSQHLGTLSPALLLNVLLSSVFTIYYVIRVVTQDRKTESVTIPKTSPFYGSIQARFQYFLILQFKG